MNKKTEQKEAIIPIFQSTNTNMKSSEEAISIFADYLDSIKDMKIFDTIKDK